MDDLISRQAVIDLLKKNVSKDIEEVVITEKHIKLIESIPTAYDVEKVVAEVQNVHLKLASQTARIVGIIRKGGVE